MLLFDGFGGLLVLGVWIFCFIDVLMTPEQACRNLPKLAWVFLVLLLPTFGSIAWLVAGPALEPHRRRQRHARASAQRSRTPDALRPDQSRRRRGVPRRPRNARRGAAAPGPRAAGPRPARSG